MPRRQTRLPIRVLTGLFVVGSMAGCELRDEQPRSGSPAAWAPVIARRLTPSTGGAAPSIARRRVECVDGFAAGSRRAADAGLPLLLIFRASWCPWSDEFLATAQADTALLGSADRFVCATVDADREAAICRSFGVRAFPTVIALDAARRERFRATGAEAREQLAAAAGALVTEPPPRMAGEPPAAPR